MFTGIVNGQGKVRSIVPHGKETRLTIESLSPLYISSKGESIAVNGTCLTVEQYKDQNVTVYISQETLNKTNLGFLSVGRMVNLEQSLAVGDRLSGHIVTGHIDCIAIVASIKKQGESYWIQLTFPKEFGKEIVSKGSIALDGISLTVNNCGINFLEVNIIPTTWKITTISLWEIGTQVNMETDVIAKYIFKMISPILSSQHPTEKKHQTITEIFLQKHGFF